MKLKIYTYKNCGTCRSALRYLDERGVSCETVPIRERPPSKAEFKRMLKVYGGQIRKLFNTSGQDYKELNLKEKLPELTENEAIELLSTNGNLVKRPFVLTATGGMVGFDEDEWEKLL
ncbi:MAG: Spx/MgsR family RNA polymerase-binding regulatory protein [Verrucomicrobia bacterium]|nr:Spx/MgsR family RNA polymerase-binding regulatory protein [Verrucomicrobiota bacterium]